MTNKIEEMVRDFCRNTPRINPESGVAFYERLLQYSTSIYQAGKADKGEEVKKVVEGMKKLTIEEKVRRANPNAFVDWIYDNEDEKRKDLENIGFNSALDNVKELL